MIDAALFQSLRPHLFSVAYRMLGSASEAEDIIQDAWLRTSAAPDDLESARAWLTTVVTRLSLDQLKSARVRREEYVGPWLPEPVPTGAVETAEDVVARRESVTMAFLVLLERLTPQERAAFLLREVFDSDYSQIARVLDSTEAAARQLVHRAKVRVGEGRPRFEASPVEQRELATRFFTAVRDGDLSRLEEMLASDVVFQADGGGKVSAARRPIVGADAVARALVGIWQKANQMLGGGWGGYVSSINGEAALLAMVHGRLNGVFVVSTHEGRISAIRVVRNPDKLAWLAEHAEDASRETAR